MGSGEAPAVTSDLGFTFWVFLSFLACFALPEAARLSAAAPTVPAWSAGESCSAGKHCV